MDAAWARVWVAAGIGLLQCAIIWHGIRMMSKASDQREQQLAENRKVMETLGQQTETSAQQTAALRELLIRS